MPVTLSFKAKNIALRAREQGTSDLGTVRSERVSGFRNVLTVMRSAISYNQPNRKYLPMRFISVKTDFGFKKSLLLPRAKMS